MARVYHAGECMGVGQLFGEVLMREAASGTREAGKQVLRPLRGHQDDIEMSEEVAIRGAVAGDADAMARLCGQLGYPTESSDMPRRLARLSGDPNARAFVAIGRDGLVVGMVTVHVRNTLNHEAPIGQITLLV